MKFSIVIPTYNRLEYLRKCLQSLFNLSKSLDFEIIVVDSGSIDGTTQFLKTIQKNHFRFYFLNHKGASRARNKGILEAKGEIIAFTDDDCQVDKNWLNEFNRSFSKDSDIVGVIGQTYYVRENYKGYFPEKVIQNPNASWPMGGNITFKREALLKAGGFDEGIAINEDTDLAFRIIAFGKLAKNPKAIAYHRKGYWTEKDFRLTYKNLSIWALLKKRYKNRLINPYFHAPILNNFIVEPRDYILIFLSPILIPVLFIRFIIVNRKRNQLNRKNIKLFFLKWPLFFLARRYYLWKEAIQQRVLLI